MEVSDLFLIYNKRIILMDNFKVYKKESSILNIF